MLDRAYSSVSFPLKVLEYILQSLYSAVLSLSVNHHLHKVKHICGAKAEIIGNMVWKEYESG